MMHTIYRQPVYLLTEKLEFEKHTRIDRVFNERSPLVFDYKTWNIVCIFGQQFSKKPFCVTIPSEYYCGCASTFVWNHQANIANRTTFGKVLFIPRCNASSLCIYTKYIKRWYIVRTQNRNHWIVAKTE